LFFQAITTALRQVERKGVITFFALTLSLAVIVFLLVSWLIVAENQLYGWLLLLTAACIAYYKSTESRQTHVKQDISDPAVAFYPTPLSPPPKSINKVLGFVLLSSFSLGFLLGQFPRTLHFAGLIANNKNLTGVITDTYLGLVGSAPLLALVSTSFVLFIVGITVMQKTFYPTPILLIALLLIIGVSVIVPQYNASPIIVLAPIAVTSLLVSSQLYLSTLFVILPYREAASRALVAATVAGAGFLIAVVMSIPHTLFPVSGDSPRQIGIYTFMIGMTAASFVVFVLFRRHLTWLYFSISDLREPLDTSSLHGSCNALASQYGLTKRETEVLEFLAIGRDGPYIQKALCISRNTFKSHSLHIYQKLGITSKQALLDLLHKNQD
jgi:DNA-binding CsgD family transcriptional regulator